MGSDRSENGRKLEEMNKSDPLPQLKCGGGFFMCKKETSLGWGVGWRRESDRYWAVVEGALAVSPR